MIQRTVRGVAGIFILLSLIMGFYVSPYWFLLAAFAGLNLLQSSFTKWCLMDDILKKFVFKEDKTLKEIAQDKSRGCTV